MILRYLTHPQVRIDPRVPVADWTLSEQGHSRALAFASHQCLRHTARIVSSAERKAVETARIIASALGLDIEIREAMGENDRSSTGFLPPPEFEAMADRFFAEPDLSVCGWERAIDAQFRIVREIEAVMSSRGESDVLCVGHGGVGTLALCHYSDLAINRSHDQPAGGGKYFAYAPASRTVLHPWRPIEA